MKEMLYICIAILAQCSDRWHGGVQPSVPGFSDGYSPPPHRTDNRGHLRAAGTVSTDRGQLLLLTNRQVSFIILISHICC